MRRPVSQTIEESADSSNRRGLKTALDVLPAATSTDTLTASPGQRTSLSMKGYRNRCPVSAASDPNSPTSHATM
jgi:hypothetical protein